MIIFQIAALYFVVFGGIGMALGATRGMPIDGIVYGTLFGPIGWIIVLIKPYSPTRSSERDMRMWSDDNRK